MSDTPRTDAARLKLDSDDSSCAIYAHTLDGSSYHGEVVRGDEMAILERENAAMREAIRDACDLIQWLKTNSYGRHLRTASTALAKLQPFLKP